MLYFFRRHKERVGIAMLGAAALLIALELTIALVREGEFHLTAVSWHGAVLVPVAIALVILGSACLLLSMAMFIDVAFFVVPVTIGLIPGLFTLHIWQMEWIAAQLAVVAVAMALLLFALDKFRREISLRASCRLPVLPHDFWWIEDMIARQDQDGEALQSLFRGIGDNDHLFERSWKRAGTLYISAIEPREDLPLIEVSVQFCENGTEQGFTAEFIERFDAIIDSAVLGGKAIFYGLSADLRIGHVQLLFYAKPRVENSMVRWFVRRLKRLGFSGRAQLLHGELRKNSEEALCPDADALERGIIAARSGMFTQFGMDVFKQRTVYLQMLFDTRDAAIRMMDEQRGKIFPISGYWETEKHSFMVVHAAQCDLRVKSIERAFSPFRSYKATLTDVETDLDSLYRTELELAEE